MKIFRPIIGFFTVRSFRNEPALSLFEICQKLSPIANLHGIQFQEDKIILAENNLFVYWENISNAPRSNIYYKDIINIYYEDIWIFILLRNGYYHRLSKWGTKRIYNHLYWDRTKGENWLVRWWYRL